MTGSAATRLRKGAIEEKEKPPAKGEKAGGKTP